MSDQLFYVGAKDDKSPLTGYVPAKFLMRNGAYVTDPTPGGSQGAYLYSGRLGSDKTDGSVANPNNYLIVPANYTEQKARDFAAEIVNSISKVYPEDEMGVAGLHQALGQMFGAFSRGGSQDLQRHPQWGIPKGSFVPAFVGSASNHLGYVSGLAGVPVPLSEIGGGVLNGANAIWHKMAHLDPIDTDGPYWLSKQNHANIFQGYSDGLATSQPPLPFNDYRYGTQPKPQEGQIGDGNGISGWLSSLSSIDPKEPPPPTWPPSDRPIRYLARRRQ